MRMLLVVDAANHSSRRRSPAARLRCPHQRRGRGGSVRFAQRSAADSSGSFESPRAPYDCLRVIRLLRNCALEQLAGFAVEEREVEMGGTLAQAVKDANTVL